MKTIQDAFQINTKSYSELSDSDKNTIDRASENLMFIQDIILSFDNEVVNFVTDHPSHTLVIDSKFPSDLTDKIVYAFVSAKYSDN